MLLKVVYISLMKSTSFSTVPCITYTYVYGDITYVYNKPKTVATNLGRGKMVIIEVEHLGQI